MTNKNIDVFLQLAKLFEENGFHLYLVGGTVRDYLLGISLDDMDACTDATPDDMKKFLSGDYSFSRFGAVRCHYSDLKFDITTLRKEKNYLDSRHPGEVIFVKETEEDYYRRDFTINALYLDKNLKIIDYVNGENDLKNGIIRMVGDPNKRIQEDPLRIIRALRFSLRFDFSIDEELETAIENNIHLLDNLNKEKIKEDIRKIKNVEYQKIEALFNKFHIQSLLTMLKL